jgi:hypothetical protein
MHRSSQRTDRCIASPTRGPTVRLDTLTISARNHTAVLVNEGWVGLTDVVELHDNVGANDMLYGDTLLGLHHKSGSDRKKTWAERGGATHTVSIVGSPVNGLVKRAPCSVIFVNRLRDTS